ncbi:hypothetical protein O9993_12235 [Vibrio lentus]|nr:hypothetical protein [Vibrio lentus]
MSQPASDSAVVIEQIKDINKSEVDGYDGIIDTATVFSYSYQTISTTYLSLKIEIKI